MKVELDDGLFFGRGVFETIKVVDKKPLLLDRHLARLERSAKYFNLANSIKKEDILAYIDDCHLTSFVLKITLTEKNTIFTTREDAYTKEDKGYRLKIGALLRNTSSHIVYHKSLNYYDNIIEKRSAKEQGYDEVIFLNQRGEISEGAVSNIFFIKSASLITPPQSSGLLRGIIRDYILEKIPVKEEIIYPKDLSNYDSAFITNSLMGARWVKEIENHKFIYSPLIDEVKKILENVGY